MDASTGDNIVGIFGYILTTSDYSIDNINKGYSAAQIGCRFSSTYG